MSRAFALAALVCLSACTTTTILEKGAPAPVPTDAPPDGTPPGTDPPPGPPALDPERSVSGKFEEMQLPSMATASFSSTGVYALAADNAFVVSSTGISRNRLHHWNGKSWTELGLFYEDGDGSSNQVFAVGSGLWAYGGSYVHDSDDSGASFIVSALSFSSMWAASQKDLWAVAGGVGGATVNRLGGQAPAQLKGLPDYKVYRPFVWGSGAADVYLGWGYDTDPNNPYHTEVGHLYHYDGKAFTDLAASLPSELTTKKRALDVVYGSSASDVWGLGGGKLVHYDGKTWSLVKDMSALSCEPQAIYATSRKNVWIAGLKGCLYHYDGTTFAPVASGTTNSIFSIHGSSPENVWIASGKTSVLRLVPSAK